MNNNYSTKPLHKTVHFRRLREVLHSLAKTENIDLNCYDLNNIRCYKSYGEYLKGKNVTVTNLPNSRTCFVSDNEYEIFEIPNKSNKKNSCIGKFLVLIKDISFDYYLLGKLNYEVHPRDGHLDDRATYFIYGQYSIESDGRSHIVKKLAEGNKCDFGKATLNYRGFDSSDFRKVVAYKTSSAKIYAEAKNIRVNKLAVVDNNEVKIYKKKGRK